MLPITTHITQRDNIHSGKMVGSNILLDPYGSRQETNREASDKIQVQHGITKQPLGTT